MQMVHKAAGHLALALTLLLLAAALLLAGARLFGLTPYAVQSGSMAPLYPVGSLIYVRSVRPEAVRPGDSITFVMDRATHQVATHQVWRVDAGAGLFYTQGIANLGPDGSPVHDGAPVPFRQLLGRPVLCIPLLGYPATWLTTPAGRCTVAALLLLALLCDLLAAKKQPRAALPPGA